MPPAIPTATYRLQLTKDFDFDAAALIAPYLKAIGISHVYASPFMKARAGSTHGYDIVDHTKLNPELGGDAGFERMSAALKKNDLGLILDFVPNHVGVHFADNPWWLDVLEWGQASPHAVSFDIDWELLPYRTRGGLLLPIIGSSYGQALENGEIVLKYDAKEGSFSAWYYEHRLPIAPERYSEMLRLIVKEADAGDTAAGRAILTLAGKHKGLRHPNRAEAPEFKKQLSSIDGAADIITRGLDAYRAAPDRPAQVQTMHLLLERQHYKLGQWRLASSEINYRRFFDVNTLAGLRVEDSGTFDAIHTQVKRLIAEDKLQGLRLDHIDGLRDPSQYFQRLRRLIREAQGKAKPFYVVVEKILGEDEKLVPFAGVHGTTGYEWLNVITQVLVEEKGLEPLGETWRQVSNTSPKFAPLLLEAKRRVLDTLLLSEFTVLSRLLARIANGHYSTRDFSADTLRQAFELYVLHFPVYRTYLTVTGPSARDRQLIEQTIAKARADWFGADEGLFDFLRDALTLDLLKPGRPAHGKPRVRRFAFKVQQFTGPTMAKSLEDTAFYRYHKLLALNEVGGEPAAEAMPVARFHELMVQRASEFPHGMTSTATHDTKRGEDARTRLLALAELPAEWATSVSRWKMLNAPHVIVDGEMRSPSAPFEYMLYQALVGAWELDADDGTFVERMQAYALKAAREGKQETSWLNPNEAYEKGLTDFLARILDPAKSKEFIEQIDAFARRMALIGAVNSLSQITLKATIPGMPDFYQGTEFFDTSLVDPDNRRPVDFAERVAVLETIKTPDWTALTGRWSDSHLKFAWTHELLKRRNEFADVFTDGDYEPLEVTGAHAKHIIAFARRHQRDAAIVIVGRALAGFTDGGRTWFNGSTLDATVHAPGYDASEIRVAEHLTRLPVAIIKTSAAPKKARSTRLR
jgi:(1->4)-alpha-D-glucan 1-alpha-D-glucosylmutase